MTIGRSEGRQKYFLYDFLQKKSKIYTKNVSSNMGAGIPVSVNTILVPSIKID
jgi:hypothetical protein